MANYYPNNQKKIFIILIFILISSCTKEKTFIKERKIYKKSNIRLKKAHIDIPKDKLLSYNIDISIGNYTVGVTTYYIEDTLLRSAYYGYYFPIVTKQEIYFIQKTDTIYKIPYPVPRVIKTSTKRKIYYVPENQLTSIGFILGKYDTICYISGDAGCDTCTKFDGYYHLSGDLIWKSYTYAGYITDTRWIEEKKYFKSEFTKMGIPTKYRKKQKMIKVFPIEKAGEIFKKIYIIPSDITQKKIDRRIKFIR